MIDNSLVKSSVQSALNVLTNMLAHKRAKEVSKRAKGGL